jgi:hypothetical protein
MSGRPHLPDRRSPRFGRRVRHRAGSQAPVLPGRSLAKPCWLTEWGISNSSKACPSDDANRRQAIEGERSALAQFVQQGKLAAAIYYTWDGVPPGSAPIGVFRCGVLTEAGAAALGPM